MISHWIRSFYTSEWKKFANLLYEHILENISDEVTFSSFNDPLLIPIPMYKNNLKERGYNQSELIVKEIYNIVIERLDNQPMVDEVIDDKSCHCESTEN